MYIVLLNRYGTSSLGDVEAVGPFHEREDAEAWIEQAWAAHTGALVESWEFEVETVKAPSSMEANL